MPTPAVTVPRLIAPSSARLVGTRRPLLRWSADPAGTGPTSVVLCRDRSTSRECVTATVAAESSYRVAQPSAPGACF